MDEYRYCSTCDAERPFERPECLDGHGADCPERCCVHCGEAILVDPPLAPARSTPRRVLAA
ncbi:hypothetical protein [Actinocatenispora thailandica]|uniref:hypothetical protein n=1 Tax=Actinocatenispora thailandica TaxID=227318 RepID=UPI0019509582|nr:hypothetical protein [Actinocatenispora thailandica]